MPNRADELDVQEAVRNLTPAQALDFVRYPFAFQVWLAEIGIPYSRPLRRAVWALADAAASSPSPGDARRKDAEELREFVERAGWLPYRLRQVAELCLDHGLSLAECARHLGISRETVRVHLRRLRALRRQAIDQGQLD